MRVFYDHQVFSLQDAGGVSRYQYELVRNLAAADQVQSMLLMGLNASVMPFSELREARCRVLAWKTHITPGYRRYALNEGISSVLAPLQGKADIYHVMLYRALPSIRRRRLVVTHHDCTHERFPQMFHNAAFIIKRKRALFSRADAILCVSGASRLDLLNFYDVAREKTHVVHHGFSPLVCAPLTLQAPFSTEPYLLYVGSRAKYKNFLVLLDAFARSGLAADYRLLVVGGGEFTEEEQTSVQSLRLSERITSVPKATEAMLANSYRNAALFVYPSLYEGFGFPPLEAMSLRCPVLVLRTSSLPEICGDAAFYFDRSNADELSHAIVSALQNHNVLEIKRALGEQQVKRYDWARTAASTLDIYRALLQ